MKPDLTLALPLTIVLATSGIVTAADWPTWRGPDGDGRSKETGLDLDWGSDGPDLLWQSEGCGRGYASVAVSGGTIYTIGRRGDAEHLVAFDEKTGEEKWATPFGRSKHSNGAPTVDDGRVYAIGRDGDLVCCDAGSGKKLWSKNFKDDFGGKMMSGWGYSESPLVDGDLVLCTPGARDAMVVALDKKTGKTVWKGAVPDDLGERGKDGAGYSGIAVSEGGGVKQYVQLTGRGVLSFRADDGTFLWNYNAVANGTANIPTPIATGDHVFCSTGYGTGSALLKLSKSGSSGVNAEEVYFLDDKTLQNHHGGMVLVDGKVYTGHKHNNGFPICVDLKSGDVEWGGDERGPGRGSAAVTYADGHLIFRYQSGTVALIEATPKKYNLVASFDPAYQEDKSWAHPVVANGRLYLREQDKLMCYNLSK